MNWPLPTLIRTDALAGITAGLLLYFGRALWAPLSGLSIEWFAGLGLVGLGYGLFSGTIALRTAYRPWPIWTLILANAAYALFCLGLLVAKREALSALGVAHLLAEIVFVGGLAFLEARAVRGLHTQLVRP